MLTQILKDNYIVLSGENNGYLATSKELKIEDKYIARNILLDLVHPPKGLIVEGSLVADEYMDLVKNNDFKSASFFMEYVGKKIISATKKDILSISFRKLFSNPDFSYPFYFIFTNRDQMLRFIPISPKYHQDSYYIYFLENEEELRRTMQARDRVCVKDIINFCYAIIPIRYSQFNFGLKIFSNFMTEDEFKAVSELALVEPVIRRLNEKENLDLLNHGLSCFIPLLNNPNLA
ncbi:MAG: hypothetical protein NT033_02360 [Candidatus Omnitrophica bacterium]|nr:hypothetical protein [Candidatus Omnitrophota bacterium]